MSYFVLEEFDCKCGCGLNNTDLDLVTLLEEARELARIPFNINSGCRCDRHNRRVGGSQNSSHLRGMAVDIRATSSKARFAIMQALFMVGFSRIGIHKKFIHVDIDRKKPSVVLFLC